jgi:hypothetical protein
MTRLISFHLSFKKRNRIVALTPLPRFADTTTYAFGAVIFTVQTVGLVVSESNFYGVLQSNAPWLASVVDVLQLAVTPDKQAPEKCAFPTTLFFKMLVEAVLQPAYAFLILAAISLPWHTLGLSCGVRFLCDAKRALVDHVYAKKHAKKLLVRWRPVRPGARRAVLVKGTWAKVVARRAAEQEAPKPTTVRTVNLAECDLAQIFVSRDTLAASVASDFDENDLRQLRRLLRMANIKTTETDTKLELLQKLRFHIDCDDQLFDNAKMPAKLARYQITQASMHLLMCAMLMSSQ